MKRTQLNQSKQIIDMQITSKDLKTGVYITKRRKRKLLRGISRNISRRLKVFIARSKEGMLSSSIMRMYSNARRSILKSLKHPQYASRIS